MARVISQAGDSTDGEDFEQRSESPNFVEEKLNQQHNKNNCTLSFVMNNNTEHFNISTSCKLRIIGHEILQSESVRNEYKKIKIDLIPDELKVEFKELDKLLGRKWSTILLNSIYKIGRYRPDWRIDIYESLRGNFDKFFSESIIFQEFSGVSEEVRAVYNEIRELFLREENRAESIGKLLNRIQFVHKEIEKNYKEKRKSTEFLIFSPERTENNACASLARLKASLKLDKDQQKNYLYDYHISSQVKSHNTPTQNEETLYFHHSGNFWHFKTSLGSYGDVESDLFRFELFIKINKNKIKNFFKQAIRGKLDKSILTDENDAETVNNLKSMIELMFGIEFKRNSAALLNNAMFLDLLDVGLYKMDEISAKMPMAMMGALKSTAVLDKHVNRPSRYSTGQPDKDVMELARREEAITQDWIRFKLNKTDLDFVENVPAEIFNELILDWYGIELPVLKKGTIKLEPLKPIVKEPQEAPENETSTENEEIETPVVDVQNVHPHLEAQDETVTEPGASSVNATTSKNLEDSKYLNIDGQSSNLKETEAQEPVNILSNDNFQMPGTSKSFLIQDSVNNFNHNVIAVENSDEELEEENNLKKRKAEFCAEMISIVDPPKQLLVDDLSDVDSDETDENRAIKIVNTTVIK